MFLYEVWLLDFFYSKFVATVMTELAGHILASRFNPVSAEIFRFMCRLLRLVRFISWFVRWYCL